MKSHNEFGAFCCAIVALIYVYWACRYRRGAYLLIAAIQAFAVWMLLTSQ